MTMTMPETKEAILATLGAANGLESQPYFPHPSTLDGYMAPGNYTYAESVERGYECVKFNWVAFLPTGKMTT